METRAIIISACVLFTANLATAQKAQDDAPGAPAESVAEEGK